MFPAAEWVRLAPEEAGFSAARLAAAGRWLQDLAGEQPFRLVIARHGDLVVALCPGPWPGMREEAERLPREQAVLGRVLDAVER